MTSTTSVVAQKKQQTSGEKYQAFQNVFAVLLACMVYRPGNNHLQFSAEKLWPWLLAKVFLFWVMKGETMEEEIPPESFVLGYLSLESHQIEIITIFDLDDLDIDNMMAVRKPKNFKGQKHNNGYYWFSKSKRHIQYESRLELFAYQKLDFDLSITRILPQPIYIDYLDDGKRRQHIPDILCERRGLPNLLIDVKPKKFINKEKNQIAFKNTALACEYGGWEYEVWSEPERSFYYNLRLLATYRRPPAHCDRITPTLVQFCEAQPRTIAEISEFQGEPFFTRPVLFHLIWHQILFTDLHKTLQDTSLITCRKWTSHEQ